MSNVISDKQWVGVDLHLHRSVIVRIDGQGKEVGYLRIDNDPKVLVREVRKAGRGAPVAIEATYGWYWAVDALRKAKFDVRSEDVRRTSSGPIAVTTAAHQVG